MLVGLSFGSSNAASPQIVAGCHMPISRAESKILSDSAYVLTCFAEGYFGDSKQSLSELIDSLRADDAQSSPLSLHLVGVQNVYEGVRGGDEARRAAVQKFCQINHSMWRQVHGSENVEAETAAVARWIKGDDFDWMTHLLRVAGLSLDASRYRVKLAKYFDEDRSQTLLLGATVLVLLALNFAHLFLPAWFLDLSWMSFSLTTIAYFGIFFGIWAAASRWFRLKVWPVSAARAKARLASELRDEIPYHLVRESAIRWAFATKLELEKNVNIVLDARKEIDAGANRDEVVSRLRKAGVQADL